MSDDAILDQNVAAGSPPSDNLYRDLFRWRDGVRSRTAMTSLRFIPPTEIAASVTQVAKETREQSTRGSVLFEMSSSAEDPVTDEAMDPFGFPNDVLSEGREFVTATATSSDGQVDVPDLFDHLVVQSVSSLM